MAEDFRLDFAKAIAEGLVSRSLTTCSRWASKRRVMGGDFAGPYSWKHHPWVKELHNTNCAYNWVMKGAQLGVTEVAINRALFTIDVLKRDVMYVMPTAKGASKFSKGRFGTALHLSPYIDAMFTDTNAVDMKQAGQNCLYISGARGNSNLKNIPASELILDELDEMEEAQIYLALERLSGQLNKHVWGISTPTLPGFGIHKLYQGTTQEHFMFKCPHCGRKTELVWPDCIEIHGEHTTDERCAESFLKCKECQHKLEHAAKPDFLAKGKWVPTAPNANPDVRGFHINQLYSFTVTPGELVVAYFRGFGDECAAKEFHNSKLGCPFIGEGARITDDLLDAATKNYSMHDQRPEYGGQRLVTLGVDQGRTGYATVCEWLIGPNHLDLQANAFCKILWCGKFDEENWGRLDELMTEWQVLHAVVDADPGISEARRFARRFPGFVGLTRYRRGQTGKEISVAEEETGAPMYTVDRSSWLSEVLNRFKANPPGVSLPHDIPKEFREHIKSTVKTYERDSHGNAMTVFKDLSADHFLHSLVYATIALQFATASHGQRLGKVL